MRPTLVKLIPLVIKMMRKILLSSVLLVIGVFVTNSLTKPKTLHCEADLVDTTNIKGIGNISSSIKLNYIFNLREGGGGIVNMIGFINSDNKRYRLDRTLNFSYVKYDDNDTYKFEYHIENINTYDTTPNVLMTAIYLTADKGGVYNDRVSKITENVYFIHEIGKPFLVCRKY